jgi:predicted nucleic acid-binding protein
MVVVEASAIVDLLLARHAAAKLADRIFRQGELIAAPHLVDPEVAHTLRRLLRIGEVDIAQANAALDLFSYIDLKRHPHDSLLRRVWSLRENLTAYDATYVALAEALKVPLITRDFRLARSSGHHARIEFIE